jgi:hypothetical protein
MLKQVTICLIVVFIAGFSLVSCIPDSKFDVVNGNAAPKSVEAAFSLPDSTARKYADNAGNQVKNKCLKYSPTGKINNYQVTILEKKVDQTDRKYILKIRISWEGGITQMDRWVEGKVVCDEDGNNAYWEKTNVDCIGCSCPSNTALMCLKY